MLRSTPGRCTGYRPAPVRRADSRCACGHAWQVRRAAAPCAGRCARQARRPGTALGAGARTGKAAEPEPPPPERTTLVIAAIHHPVPRDGAQSRTRRVRVRHPHSRAAPPACTGYRPAPCRAIAWTHALGRAGADAGTAGRASAEAFHLRGVRPVRTGAIQNRGRSARRSRADGWVPVCGTRAGTPCAPRMAGDGRARAVPDAPARRPGLSTHPPKRITFVIAAIRHPCHDTGRNQSPPLSTQSPDASSGTSSSQRCVFQSRHGHA